MSERIEDHRDESGRLHRIGGPASVWNDGAKFWCRHGKRHRCGGPATISSGGDMFWYINGRHLCSPDKLPEAAHPIMELFL